MSIEEMVERGKTALLEAKMVVHTEGGYVETTWVNTHGLDIAWCMGVPHSCTNSPHRTKLYGVHFYLSWRMMLGEQARFESEDGGAADWKLGDWINKHPFVASECISLGHYVTKGTWHPAKNRWMWGPKQNRH